MAESELTHKDRSYAATAGVPGTPFDTPPKSQSPRNSDAGTKSNVSVKLPLASYCIIVVEGCERFCFYGLRAILLLYFMQFLSLNKDDATVGYHLFSFACYFTPIIGAIVSDGFIGRYWTILVFAIVYLAGDIVLTVTAIPYVGRMALTGPIIGLLFVALGTGGIKPCVGPFGAEQISNSNAKQISRYFAIYYFSINVGSFISTLVTPAVRSYVQCFGYNCYSLAFGIPTILMFIAIVLYIIGTPLYRRVPPKENIIARFIAIIWRAVRNAICGPRSQRKESCLSYADDKYSSEDIEDVRSVFRVFVVFIPLPIYFALYNQSGSRWTYQASLMNGNFGALGTIQPDQMQALNSILILLFIPLFEEVIYPLCARCNFLVKPLPRMFTGMIVMLVAFLVAAVVQVAIQSAANTIPIRTSSSLFNGYNCGIIVNHDNRTIQSGQTIQYPCTKLLEQGLLITSTCTNADTIFKLSPDELCPSVLILSATVDQTSKETIGLTALSNTVANQESPHAAALLRVVSLDGQEPLVKAVPNNYEYVIEKKLVPTEYKTVLPATYHIEIQPSGEESVEKFRVYTTGIYTALVYKKNNTEFHATLFKDIPPHTIHILWQTIQYVLLTASEILVSITGLMFAYSQAPKRYKTVIMSVWLLTSAFGDLIVVLVAEVRLVKNQALEFLLFALFMAIAAFIFVMIAMRYKEYQPTHDDTEDQQLILEKTSPEAEEIIQ